MAPTPQAPGAGGAARAGHLGGVQPRIPARGWHHRGVTHPDADADHSFAQVAVDRPEADWSANCGNLSSAVGPFAVDEGVMRVADGPDALVRIQQVNTRRILHARLPVQAGRAVTQVTTGADGLAHGHSAVVFRTARRRMQGEVAVPRGLLQPSTMPR